MYKLLKAWRLLLSPCLLVGCTHELHPGQIEAGPVVRDPNAVIAGEIGLSQGLTPLGAAKLFIIAHRKEKPFGPPLAVKAITDPVFPLSFEMSQKNVVNMTQSAVPPRFAGELVLKARLDQDGNPLSVTPGDLATASDIAVDVGEKHLRLLLDKIEDINAE